MGTVERLYRDGVEIRFATRNPIPVFRIQHAEPFAVDSASRVVKDCG